MANYCANFLTITGNKTLIATIKKQLIKDDISMEQEIINLPETYTFNEDINCSDTVIDLTFDTKWSPPIEAYQYLMDEYKTHGAIITAQWHEPGDGIAGELTDEGFEVNYEVHTQEYTDFVYKYFLDRDEEFDNPEYHTDLIVKI